MHPKNIPLTASFFLLTLILSLAVPSPVLADGGPIVPHDLWADLEEGHQIGVVTIIDENTVRMDLFISILDKTPVSHEITFFIPIGKNTSDFYAVEEELLNFDKDTTRYLDEHLREGASSKEHAVQALFSGALLTNGAILIPAWAPVLLTGCAAATPQPEAVITTESSQISIYGIDDNTDLEALIQTSGLPDSVIGTLSRLKGQQIAIVNLNTKPANTMVEENENPWESPTTEPGLHLQWITQPIETEIGRTVTYPLGTGDAWAKPIKITRVYINAAAGMDFDVTYPELGEQHSGFDIIEGSYIYEFLNIPSYAVDETKSSSGRIWRATYTQSNPTDDVIITVKTASGFGRFMSSLEEHAFGYSVAFAIILSILVWVLAWRLLMPVLTGKSPEFIVRPWYEALIYPGINLIFLVFPGSVLYLVYLLGGTAPALVIQFIIGAGISLLTFWLVHSKRLGVSRSRAFAAFILTSLSGSTAYLLLAVAFGFLVNAI